MGGVSANARKYIIAQAFSEFVTKQCRHSVLHFGKFACEVSDCFYRVLASVHGRRPVRPKARAAGGDTRIREGPDCETLRRERASVTRAKATVECNVATIRAVRGVGDAAGAAEGRTSIPFFSLGTSPLLHCRTALM